MKGSNVLIGQSYKQGIIKGVEEKGDMGMYGYLKMDGDGEMGKEVLVGRVDKGNRIRSTDSLNPNRDKTENNMVGIQSQ